LDDAISNTAQAETLPGAHAERSVSAPPTDLHQSTLIVVTDHDRSSVTRPIGHQTHSLRGGVASGASAGAESELPHSQQADTVQATNTKGNLNPGAPPPDSRSRPSTTANPADSKSKSLVANVTERVKAVDWEYIAQTTDSFVTFALEGLKSAGGNLPGIGAVAIVLSAKDKIMIDMSNRKAMEQIFTYIEDLCNEAGSAEEAPNPADVPAIGSPSDELIKDLKQVSEKLNTTKARKRFFNILNAQAIKTDLDAVWRGIERAMIKCGLKMTIETDKTLNNVLQIILESQDILLEVRAAQSARHYHSLDVQET